MSFLPNLVTASRGLAGPLVAWLLVAHGAHIVAFAVFIGAMLTDLVDGWLARRLDAHSELGVWLDPISDKVLTDTTWIALWSVGWAPGWLVAPLLVRDLLVVVGFASAHARGLRWEPSMLGRLAVSFEGVALPVLLVHVRWLDVHWYTVGVLLGALTLALSVLSVLQYVTSGPRRPDAPGQD